MKPRLRARIYWLLAALTIAYSLATVVVFYATGTFGAAWLGVSLSFHGALLVGALLLLVTQKPARFRARVRVARLSLVRISPRVALKDGRIVPHGGPQVTRIDVVAPDERDPSRS